MKILLVINIALNLVIIGLFMLHFSKNKLYFQWDKRFFSKKKYGVSMWLKKEYYSTMLLRLKWRTGEDHNRGLQNG